jgi:hypothetical protein
VARHGSVRPRRSHSFWEILLGWNAEYAAFTYGGNYSRAGALYVWAAHYFPWSLADVLAAGTALAAVTRAVRAPGTAGPASTSRALLSAFYLGWLAQAVLIQRCHVYVLVTTVFPAVVLVAGALQAEWRPSLGRAFLLIFVPLAIILMLGLSPGRVALWARCWREGSTPELRDRLALNARWPGAADWRDLARVANFLRAQGVGDRELVCLSGCTHPLYLELNLEPPTRFPQIGATLVHFPGRAEEVCAELDASRGRYAVSDLGAGVLTYDRAVEEVAGGPLALPPSFPPCLLGTYPCGANSWCSDPGGTSSTASGGR